MQYREFGHSGIKLSRIGLGCFSMSGAYGAADDDESIATIHQAMERGVNLLDSSARYGGGHNHRLIGEAIKGRRDQIFIHSKTGTIRDSNDRSVAEGSGRPDRLRQICEMSLKNLGVDYLDAMCQSRVDPSIPIEESVGAVARLVEEGKVRFIGLSEAAPDTVRRASKVHPIVSLQYEYSLWTRDVEEGHRDACDELGMALMAYAPLGYGFLAGVIDKAGSQSEDDIRGKFPRFYEENFDANRQRVARLESVAADRGTTAAQIAIAWVLAQDDSVFPIPGCKSRKHLDENLDAVDIELTSEDIVRLDEIFPKDAAAGTRYPPGGMQRVNL
ncbi:MAG: aldo/keto reductase [Alphaproteobacteria bacterium]|nr:aldo/keto reductase [Alphaproteobacteria bacterium]